MKIKTITLLKRLFILLLVACGILIFIMSVKYFEYLPIVNPGNDLCSPDPLGIYENDIYHHTLTPCSKFIESPVKDKIVLEELDHLIKVDINSLGFRNNEYRVDKKEGQKRIILLGDATTYGYGLNIEDTFFKILEKDLSRRYRKKIEVWNLAAISWSTAVQYLIAKNKLPQYVPDLVVLMFDASDCYDNPAYEKFGVFENGDLVSLKGDLDAFYDKRNKIKKEIRKKYKKDKLKKKKKIKEIVSVSVAYIKKISELMKRDNTPFLVVFYPHRSVKNTKMGKPLRLLLKSIRKSNIPCLNLYDHFTDKQRSDYYFEANGNWNKSGSKHVASILKEYICENYGEVFEK